MSSNTVSVFPYLIKWSFHQSSGSSFCYFGGPCQEKAKCSFKAEIDFLATVQSFAMAKCVAAKLLNLLIKNKAALYVLLQEEFCSGKGGVLNLYLCMVLNQDFKKITIVLWKGASKDQQVQLSDPCRVNQKLMHVNRVLSPYLRMCLPALSPPLDTFKDPNILSALCCPELHAVFEVISDAFCSEQHYLRFCLEIDLGDFFK